MGRRAARQITARQIPGLPPGRHRIAGSLYLLVRPSGARSWIQRLRIAGREVVRGLGRFPDVSIDAAKAAALANRHRRNEGVVLPCHGQNDNTSVRRLKDALAAFRERNIGTWADTTRRAFDSITSNHLSALANVPVAALTRETIIDHLRRVPGSSARKARSILRQVLSLAVARGWIGTNPADSAINAALAQSIKRQSDTHHAAAHHRDVRGILDAIRDKVSLPVRNAVEFAILTAARSNEVRGARWEEIDFDAAEWTIPASRMKTRVAHKVPLCAVAGAILREQQALGLSDTYIFPSAVTKRPITQEGLLRVVRPHGCTLHGFRSSFRVWAAETNQDREAAEHALSHSVGSAVERAYQRSDLIERRCKLMTAWAHYIGSFDALRSVDLDDLV